MWPVDRGLETHVLGYTDLGSTVTVNVEWGCVLGMG